MPHSRHRTTLLFGIVSLMVGACAAPVAQDEASEESVGTARQAMFCADCDDDDNGGGGGGGGETDPGGESSSSGGESEPGSGVFVPFPGGWNPGGILGPIFIGGDGQGNAAGSTDGGFDCYGSTCSWELSDGDRRRFEAVAGDCSGGNDRCASTCASAGGDSLRCRNNCSMAFNRLCGVG